MGYPPVVVVESGGVPRTQVAEGVSAPAYTVVESGARPITLTDNAPPIALFNEDGSHYTTEPAPEYVIVIAGHQSNMVGGQSAANGGTITAADDPDPRIFQWSPNGGGASGNPPTALTLLEADQPLLFPSTLDAHVGPALSYAKLLLATLQPHQKVVIIPGGKGGTGLNEWVAGQPLFDSMADAYDAFVLAYPDSVLHSVILSPLENEMANGIAAATTATWLDNTISAYRTMAGFTVPIYMAAPVPEYVSSDTFRAILLEGAKAAVRNPMVGMCGGKVSGFVGGDTWHYTNASNRGDRAQWLFDQIARTASLNSSAPSQVTEIDLVSETLTFTSVGAPYYDIQTRAYPGGGAWTSNLWVPNQNNSPGQEFTLTLPGSGEREGRIIAKSYGGDSTPSDTVLYEIPDVVVPTPLIRLDFANATMGGAGSAYMTSVPSDGTDTTAWIPTSSAGTGDLALIPRIAQNGINIGDLPSGVNKRFHRSGYTFPAGSYTFIFPFYYDDVVLAAMFAWLQASTSGDIYLGGATSGTNLRMNHTTANTTGQLITTDTPLSGQTNKWHCVAFTYDSTTHIGEIFLNGVSRISGSVTARSGTPNNSGGSTFWNYNSAATNNGLTKGKLTNECAGWNEVLTLEQIQAYQAAVASKYAISFG